MPGADYRNDNLAAFRREIDMLKRQVQDLALRAPLRSSSISDDDGNIIVRFNGEGLQFLNPATGVQVAEFAGENLTFRDAAGNAVAQLDDDGVTVLDATGNPLTTLDPTGVHVFDGANEITSIDEDGLTVFNAAGVPQLKVGNLNGAGDFGVEVQGGRLRAMAIDTQFSTVNDVSLNTTLASKTSINIVPPSWATEVHVFAWLVFRLHNPTAGVVGQKYRIDFEGDPGTGAWTNDVQPGGTQTANEASRDVFNSPLPSPINVQAIAAVHTGTNSTNAVRLQTMAFFLR